MQEELANGLIILHCGDCLHVLKDMEANSVDSVVCDPPYHLTAGGSGGGFMGKAWDGGNIAFRAETWKAVMRVLRPGSHLVAFSGTRTYHRMACAIEDAGFEIRDLIFWAYGSGFPKSLDVSKAIDRAAGVERDVIGVREYAGGHVQNSSADKLSPPIWTFIRTQDDRLISAPATASARQWNGFGTALKPAVEPICLARKPLSESTIAANVLKWGTGALNIDGCRIEGDEDGSRNRPPSRLGSDITFAQDEWTKNAIVERQDTTGKGRWPANLIHDGSPEVMEGFPESGPPCGSPKKASSQGTIAGSPLAGPGSNAAYVGDTGSAARFFYTAKADSMDRLGSKHPTVKPVDLMQWLVRLVTPPKGKVLDPFAGTGTTGEAVYREGFSAVLIEREAEYQNDIRRRMALLLAGPDERSRESIKARGLVQDAGPLFG